MMWYDAHFYHAFIIKIVLSVSEGKTSSLFKEDEVSILHEFKSASRRRQIHPAGGTLTKLIRHLW